MKKIEPDKLKSADKITTIFLDLDETLWKGIIAEGQKPLLYEERYKLLKTLNNKGIQIYVVSKNDEKDVNKAFKDLGIDTDLFTWVIANWDPKFANIERLIHICKIRPETAIFIDDNTFELNETASKIDDLLILDANNFDFLLDIPAIKNKKEQVQSELEDRKNRYRTAIKTEFLKENFKGDDIEFYKKLKREISLGIVPVDNLDRATRLLVETHRLNFNPDKFINYDKALAYLHDRFNAGDLVYAVSTFEGEHSLGLTGVLIINIDDKLATITDGTFSCGIIGRGFESAAILEIIRILQSRNIYKLNINFTLTSTNVGTKDILTDLGFNETSKKIDEQGRPKLVYTLDLKSYKDEGKYGWITVSDKQPVFDYVGHPYVIAFFEKYVKPKMTKGRSVINLGSARGEVFGHLQPSIREGFYKFIDDNDIKYIKIDIDYIPEEDNIVANADDLSKIIDDNSQDLVMAIELLEYTQKPWRVVNEMSRICKKGGYIFISVPSFGYAKHEYPIDLWRFGPKTLKSFFNNSSFEVEKLELEGDQKYPRRTMILIKKTKAGRLNVDLPKGNTDIKRGLTIFN
jgi:FkbH-like protein